MRAFLGILALLLVATASLILDAQASTGTTELISKNQAGQGGASSSNTPAISDDGRFVAFTSGSSIFVQGDTNGKQDVFLRDRATGQTEILSVSSGGQQGNANSWLGYPAISADGRFVAFISTATNLVPNDTNGMGDIFVRDRQTGLTERVNVTNTGSQAGMFTESYVSGMSADGRYVAFHTNANLDPTDANGYPDAYVRDRLLGTSTRVSMHPDGGPQSQTIAYSPNISANGRFVGFYSHNALLPIDTNFQPDIYVYDRELGTRALVSATPAGLSGNNRSEYRPSLSADGRFVSFFSTASDLVVNDTNNIGDIFVRDRDSDIDGIFDEPGAVATTLVSTDSSGVLSNGQGAHHSITDDGRYVAFDSEGTNLVGDDTNGVSDIFLHDNTTGQTSRVSVSSSGAQGDGASNFPDFSGDGTAITFFSVASTLVSGDSTNPDVLVHSFTGPGATPAPTLAFTPTPGVTPVPTPTPTPIPTPIPTGPLVDLALDTDPAGNGAALLGVRQACRSTSVGNVFDVDMVVRSAPPPGIRGFLVHLLYNPAVLRVIASNSALMLAAGGSMNPIPLYDPYPDADGNFMVGNIDQSEITETGDGVLVRVTLEAAGNGTSPLDLNDTSGADADGYPDIQGWGPGVFMYDNIAAADGQVRVGQACPGVTLTPTPAPTPTPTPTATPAPTAAPTPTPTASPTPHPLPNDDDGDLVANSDEPACGGANLNAALRPERIDGPFSQRDDDGDGAIDESLPSGTGLNDCDGDGYTTAEETHVFAGQPNKDQDSCGLGAWPADFVAGSIPDSTNRVTLIDLASYLAPARRLNTSPGDAGYSVRWDLDPGAGFFTEEINIMDLSSLITSAPPMFGGARAFGALTCPWQE